MKRALPILVINLESSVTRLALLRRQFERMGMEFERVPAIDGLTLPKETYKRYAYRWDRPMSHSEVACLLSHSLCWRRAAEGNGAVIMEDDQVLADEIEPVLAALEPREGALLFNLETQPRRRRVAPEPSEMVAGVKFYELCMAIPGAGAYVITREAAKVLLARLESHAAIADHYIHSTPGIRRFQADPGLTLELTVMASLYRLPRGPEAYTTITSVSDRKIFGTRFRWAIQYPRLRLRRALNQICLLGKKLRAAFVSVHRKIEPSPSILANYHQFYATVGGKGAANG